MSNDRVARLDRALEDQRRFLHRIPDPDTRERAEEHLMTLVGMRDEAHEACRAAQREFGHNR